VVLDDDPKPLAGLEHRLKVGADPKSAAELPLA
jgi:hypothetical protein